MIPLGGNILDFFCYKIEKDSRIKVLTANFVDTKLNASFMTLLNFFQTITKPVLRLFDFQNLQNMSGYCTYYADCDVYLVLVVLLLTL